MDPEQNSQNEDLKLENIYFNVVQMICEVVKPHNLFAELGRGSGKTTFLAKRMIDVAVDLPRETSVLAHKSYIALMANIVPSITEFFSEARGVDERPLLREGIDYVIGLKDLPKHFAKPRYRPEHPEHMIFFANGHNIRLASTDQNTSVAGSSVAHLFIEEMKHNKGEKLKSRIIPALRVGRLSRNATKTQQSPYYQGITGVSDTARVSLGEDSWFNDYEGLMDQDLIAEIVSMSLHINEAMYMIQQGKDIDKARKRIDRFAPILSRMRKAATLYLRASTFVNRDVLGVDYFQTQYKALTNSEFLTSICSVRERKIDHPFFANFDENTHNFDDSYKYEAIMKLNLKDSFRITSEYLKYYDPKERIEIGFDPGGFASFVVAQPKKRENEYRILKEFFVYSPQDIADIAEQFDSFFVNRINRNIDMYYDRAGNQRHPQKRQFETDARELKAELEKRGWNVFLMCKHQRTIYHWEHYKLLLRLFDTVSRSRYIPKILIDANECPNLISAINVSPLLAGSNPIELDKSSEKKIPLHLQAGLSTQIPSGLMYLLWGKFNKFMTDSDGSGSNLPINVG